MKPIKFQNCRFAQSSDGTNVPRQPIPHLVLVGRSNVGKSSLVNHLCNNKKLARVSQTPGKTALLQFFLIDESIFLVDLPGYGFSKRSKEESAKWGPMIEKYLTEYLDQIVFLHLLDPRHPPTELDLQFIDWAWENGKKVLFVLTKIDKIQKTVQKSAIEKYIRELGEEVEYLPYTILESRSRDELIKRLNIKFAQLGELCAT